MLGKASIKQLRYNDGLSFEAGCVGGDLQKKSLIDFSEYLIVFMLNISPFTTWIMPHILSNVMSCHCYNLRIIGHFQQPRQNPFKETQ